MSRFYWSLEFRGAVVHVDGVTGGCADVLVDYTRTLVPVAFDVGFWRFGEPVGVSSHTYLGTCPFLLIC